MLRKHAILAEGPKGDSIMTVSTSKHDKYIEYCMSVADEFQARINRMRNFVSHNLSSGTANESILREFLALHAPSEIGVGQGFILDPFDGDGVGASKQCDILVYDQTNYPLVYADGPIKVVMPQAARMVIEVKTTLDGRGLQQAIDNIISAHKVVGRKHGFQGVIFAFQSTQRLGTLLKSLKQHPTPTHAPTAILLLDKGIVIHRYGWLRQYEMRNKPQQEGSLVYPYAMRRARSTRKSAVVLTFLLLLYFHAMHLKGFFESIPINAIIETMEEHTELLYDDMYIGAPPTE